MAPRKNSSASPLGGVCGDQQPHFYFGTPSVYPKLINVIS